MIGKLKGIIDSYGEDWVIVDVGGVGYLVHCPVRTLQQLPAPGGAASLSIETYLREDVIRLYGFADELEREWFRMLMTVQGVGARVALAILGVLKPSELASAVALQDKTAIARAPGVGRKLAERVVAELRDKVPAFAPADPALAQLSADMPESGLPTPVADAVSALTNLGYPRLQAGAAVSAALKSAGESATTETLIRLGLKELVR